MIALYCWEVDFNIENLESLLMLQLNLEQLLLILAMELKFVEPEVSDRSFLYCFFLH